MTKLDTLLFIVFGGCILFLVNSYAIKQDYMTMQSYDGCYEVYADNHMPSQLSTSFMTDCMK